MDRTYLEGLPNSMTLGFDVRTPHIGANEWTDDLRAKFLIRPDVQRPLSVDRAVWPSVAEGPHNNPLDLWNSVTEITRKISVIDIEPGSGPLPAVIEVEVISEKQFSPYWQNVFQGYIQPEEQWLRLSFEELGYDVADSYLLSGLSNCMLSQQELGRIRPEWAPKINEFGLLANLVDASGFRADCALLIPEHVPFHVYRLSKVYIIADP